MRLAFCNATRRWGGVKTWSIEFAAALQAQGHMLHVYGKDSAFIERARNAGLDAKKVNFGCDYNPLSLGYFLREFQQKKMDAVLVNVGKDLRTAGLAARILGIPLVQRIGLPGDRRNSLSVRLDDFLLRPHYLCPCRYIRDGMLRELPFVHAGRASVVYSAKDPLTRSPALPERPLRIVSSSQVNANKGHKELAHTLARLKGEGHDFVWEVAGTGNMLDALRALCDELGLSGQTHFHGFVQNVPQLLRTCDVFVLSSYTEGLPNTLLEAMACGLVPIARDVGGVKECMPPELSVFLAPLGYGAAFDGWADIASETMPLYTPLKRVLSAQDSEVSAWKNLALAHCREHFSLAVQSRKLADFFAKLPAATLPS